MAATVAPLKKSRDNNLAGVLVVANIEVMNGELITK
jgi:hypothetical protein